MSEDRDPTIDGTLWVDLTQEEAKEVIKAQRKVIDRLKDQHRGDRNLLREMGHKLLETAEMTDA